MFDEKGSKTVLVLSMNPSRLLIQVLLLISAVSVSVFLLRTPIATAQEVGTVITLETSSSEVYVGDNFTVSGLLSTQAGVSLPNANVTISWADSVENVLTDEFGAFRASIAFSVGFPPGPSNISAMYVPSQYTPYLSSSKSVQVTVLYWGSTISAQISPSSLAPSAQAQLTGNLTTEGNEPITNRTVSILLDGHIFGTARTDKLGFFAFSFTVPSNLQGGSHQIIVAFNPGVNVYLPSNATITFSVTLAPVQETETARTQQVTNTSSSVRENASTLSSITSSIIWDFTIWTAITSITLLVGSELLLPRYARSFILVDKGRLRLGALVLALVFIAMIALRIYAILNS